MGCIAEYQPWFCDFCCYHDDVLLLNASFQFLQRHLVTELKLSEQQQLPGDGEEAEVQQFQLPVQLEFLVAELQELCVKVTD